MATRLEPASLAGRLAALLGVASGGGRVLISSRTNYFPNRSHLRTAADAALAQALGTSAGLRRIEIQPFSDEQVAALVRRIRKEGTADRTLERIANIYDLRDLVRRPLLLGMVLSTLDSLDNGARVGRADLYEAYIGRWLDQTRKEDPECFTDAEKMGFAEALAEEMWRSGQPSCTWQDLQRSVRMRLVPILRDDMPVGAALLEMQGGAFFVHEGEDRYRFAHKSFLEYFLARALVATLADRAAETLSTMPITFEVAAFVGEILRRMGDPHEASALRAVTVWLTDRRLPEVGAQPAQMFLASTAVAAANAVRLLLGLARWANDGRPWMPDGADLRQVVLVNEDLQGASLVCANLAGAELSGANLSKANLAGANLAGARLVGSNLDRTNLARVNAHEADFTLAEGDRVDLSDADFANAVLRQSIWTECRWEGANIEGAEATGWGTPGSLRTFRNDGPIDVLPEDFAVVLAAGHARGVQTVVWSPDGKHIASGGDDYTVRLWDSATRTELARLEGHTNSVISVAWSPDCTRLVSGGEDNTVRLWDATTGAELACLEGHTEPVVALAWSPDGTLLVSGGDDTLRLWNTTVGLELARLVGHTAPVRAVTWSPDGTRLASGGHDNTVRLWDVNTKKELACLKGHAEPVFTVAWSPDGKCIASGGADNTLRLWDPFSQGEVAVLEGDLDCVNAVAWSPDGTHIASGGDDRAVRLWHVAGRVEVACLDGHSDYVKAVAWSPDGTRLVSGGDDGTLRIWDMVAGAECARLEGHADWLNAVAWSPDGTQLVIGGYGGVIRLWDPDGGAELAHLETQVYPVLAVAWSPDGKSFASGGGDNTVRLWSAGTKAETARFEGHSDWVRAVSWSPDSSRILSGGDDNVVRLWDVVTGTELARLEGHTESVRAVGWSPDGTRFASGGYDSVLRLWDAVACAEIARLEGHVGYVRAVAWSPDGMYLASGGYDNTVRIWNATTGAEIVTLKGHTAAVDAVAWSPDGTRLVSGGSDNVVRLWDVATRSEVASLTGHNDFVKAVAWSPDGKRFVSTGYDSTVRLWDARRAISLAILELATSSAVTFTPAGFCIFNDSPSTPARLALRRPDSRTTFYLPLSGLRRVLHRPDLVRAALSGDLSGNEVRSELERRGWTGGVLWDGKLRRIPHTAYTRSEGVSTPVVQAFAVTRGNPFSPGPALSGEPPPGREPVVREILALLRKKRPAPAILRGPRRSGKTSILHHLRILLGGTHSLRLVTLEGRIGPLITADDLARTIEPSLAKTPSPADALREALRREKNAILLVDEVANLSGADASLFAWLRAVGQEGTGVVLAGSHWDWVRVVERAATITHGSSFGNDVTPVTLGPLSDGDALNFLVETAPPDVPLMRDGTAKWILELCGPWPFYLQVMGFSIVQAVREGERRALVEPVGVRDLYDQRLLLDRSAGYFATRWAELPVRAQRVLETIRKLPVGELPRARDLPPEDLGALQDVGLCDELDRWLPDRPFYDWVRRIHRRRS